MSFHAGCVILTSFFYIFSGGGERERGREGERERGREGKRERGREGKREKGKKGKREVYGKGREKKKLGIK